MFKNMKFTSKLYSSYALILSLMLVITLFFIFEFKHLASNSNWVNHTHATLEKASDIEAAAVDMETGMRGYLLAGKDSFLTPYKNGEKVFYELTSSLSETVSDNPAQVALIKEINSTIKQWQHNVTQPMIALRADLVGQAKSMDDIADLVGQAKGKAYFDKFRQQIQTFKDREKILMDTRMAELKKTELAIINVTILGTLLVIVFCISISVWLNRHIISLFGGEKLSLSQLHKLEMKVLKHNKVIKNNLLSEDELFMLNCIFKDS